MGRGGPVQPDALQPGSRQDKDPTSTANEPVTTTNTEEQQQLAGGDGGARSRRRGGPVQPDALHPSSTTTTNGQQQAGGDGGARSRWRGGLVQPDALQPTSNQGQDQNLTNTDTDNDPCSTTEEHWLAGGDGGARSRRRGGTRPASHPATKVTSRRTTTCRWGQWSEVQEERGTRPARRPATKVTS